MLGFWALLAAFVTSFGAAAGAEAPPEVRQATRGPGSAGLLWGRLAVEEESPEGSWTPLAGVEVTVYPYAPGVAAELEGIRQRARNSATEYDTAASRLQERLRVYAAQLGAGGRQGVPSETSRGAALVRYRVTDPAGIFVFEDLPPGEWLLVAIRLSPYTVSHGLPPARRAPRKGGESTFLPSPVAPAKEAEVWVTRVPVTVGHRVRVLLTDRARFMVGPVR